MTIGAKEPIILMPMRLPTWPNERWSMDFLSDLLADGWRMCVFAAIDQYSRESLAVEPGTSFPGSVVSLVLDRMRRHIDRWLPLPFVCHPYPSRRLCVTT